MRLGTPIKPSLDEPAVQMKSPIILRLLVSISLLIPFATMATETPAYTVIQKTGDYEVRQYAPRIIAEVSVSGDLDTATSEGFRTLASFIFGNNRAPNSPTITVAAEESVKIEMTAPVTVEPVGFKNTFTDTRDWRVEFSMPSQYTLETLPRPNNTSVRIRALPNQTYAAVRYSGMNTGHRINEETRRLLDWIQAEGLFVLGSPELARYNPPWTLPIFRRNEILVPIRDLPVQ